MTLYNRGLSAESIFQLTSFTLSLNPIHLRLSLHSFDASKLIHCDATDNGKQRLALQYIMMR